MGKLCLFVDIHNSSLGLTQWYNTPHLLVILTKRVAGVVFSDKTGRQLLSRCTKACVCNQQEFSDWTHANIFFNVVEFSVIVSLWWREFETCTHICYSTGCMIFQYIKSTSNWTELLTIIIINIKKGLILRYWMTFWFEIYASFCQFAESLAVLFGVLL